jgi:hypothetical protein
MTRPMPSYQLHALWLTLSLATLLLAPGCGSEAIPIASVPADATEKVEKGQTKPVAKADRLPPDREQSKGRPY